MGEFYAICNNSQSGFMQRDGLFQYVDDATFVFFKFKVNYRKLAYITDSWYISIRLVTRAKGSSGEWCIITIKEWLSIVTYWYGDFLNTSVNGQTEVHFFYNALV